RGVDVLVGRREREAVAGELLLDPIQRRDEDPTLVVGQETHPGEHLHVRVRTREVVAREASIERKADGEREELVGGTLAEATMPQRLTARRALPAHEGALTKSSLTRHPDPAGATTSRPKGPRAARSPRNPGGGTRRRRRRSRGRGRRGFGARAGRRDRSAPPRAAAGPRRSRAPGWSRRRLRARASAACATCRRRSARRRGSRAAASRARGRARA